MPREAVRNCKGRGLLGVAGQLWLGQMGPIDASSRSCNSQSRRVQDCAGSLMEEVAKAECVSAYPGGEGWSQDRPHRSPPSAKSAPMGAPQVRLPVRTPPLRPTRPQEDPN